MARQLPVREEKDSTAAFFFLFLYTASTLIRPHEMFQTSIDWIVIKVFAIIAFCLVLVAQRPLKLYPQHWMLLALLPFIIMSGFLNGSGIFGIEEAQKLLITAIIPLFLMSTCITTIKRQHILMVICLIAALLMVHNGHVQQTAYQGFGWALNSHSVGYIDLGERRITYLGFFNDPNDLGMFLVMNIPFVIYFYKKARGVIKLAMFAMLAILGYGIYLTGSRGSMLGAGGLLGIYILVVNAGPKLFISAVLLAPIAATVVASLQSSIDASANGRLEAWYAGIQMLISNPIFGVGKGQFFDHHGLVAHNSYIHVAGELGVPGYSLWGGALIFTVLTGYLFIKASKLKKDAETTTDDTVINEEFENERLLNKTLFFSMIGFMITGFFISRMFTLTLFIFMGMAIASHIRMVKVNPEYKKYFSNSFAFRSMGYCWVVIVAVYISLKLGL
ncbi:O-antigen ligase family protein [Colwellia sp. 4_MG-2023]|uniref:O-antigen ligase family protein n=1 Tax=unclassified Colwellia TaxID=196834 RepID=UPI0026E39DBD|nr:MULTISPECIES: O-antigen ligase family protein [unclassified Colwellia]MDO6506834.1 O-antigen ligase family protein [Colwellia sp. 5_MG-2023]MDO6555791.1 O-antigen ligase family protein [Colwellia sp. 4_MG-2023]